MVCYCQGVWYSHIFKELLGVEKSLLMPQRYPVMVLGRVGGEGSGS